MTKKMTAQGILNFVYKFILKQGPAISDTGLCEYRNITKDGKIRACAAGCLLSDDEAALLPKAGQAGLSWGAIAEEYIPTRFHPFMYLIRDLQIAHDRAARQSLQRHYIGDSDFRDIFKENIEKTAKFHELKSPVVRND